MAVARVEVERAELPTLKVDRLPQEERGVAGATAAVNGKVVLARWRDDAPTHFRLSAAGAEDRIEAYVRRGRRFAYEPVEGLRILYKQSEQNWALGRTAPSMSADGEDAESELTLRGTLAPQAAPAVASATTARLRFVRMSI